MGIKKRFLFILIGLLSIFLVACGAKEETTTLELNEEGVSVEITYTANDDKVTKQTSKSTTEYAALAILGIESKEDAEEMFGAFAAEYEDIDGVEQSTTYEDDKMIEELSVDFEKADMEDIQALTGTLSDGDLKNGVSLEESIKLLEEQGYKVKK